MWLAPDAALSEKLDFVLRRRRIGQNGVYATLDASAEDGETQDVVFAKRLLRGEIKPR